MARTGCLSDVLDKEPIICEDLAKQRGFCLWQPGAKTWQGLLAQHSRPRPPAPCKGRGLPWSWLLAFRGAKEGQRVLLGLAVSQVPLIRDNQYAALASFGVARPEPLYASRPRHLPTVPAAGLWLADWHLCGCSWGRWGGATCHLSSVHHQEDMAAAPPSRVPSHRAPGADRRLTCSEALLPTEPPLPQVRARQPWEGAL